MKAAINTVDEEEIAHFSQMADQWWDENGKFKPLHRLNPTRIDYIKEQVANHFGESETLQNKTLLDIGCGGGLIAEPMARLGAKVTGIDAAEKNIAVARLHAKQSGLTIDYKCTTAESLVMSHESLEKTTNDQEPMTSDLFDVVLALEIIEHVADIPGFVQMCCKLVKPGGLMIFSTINRTPKSYALAIVGAEYVLRWLPRGTHDWHKFVRPSELCRYLRDEDCLITSMTGMVMNPLNCKWELNRRDLSVNYLLAATKPE